MYTDFSSKIILSNEAHFHLDSFLSRQNCHFLGSQHPHVVKNEVDQAVTVTGAPYRDTITQFFLLILVYPIFGLNKTGPRHGASKTIQLLHKTFPSHVLSLVSVIRISCG